MAGTDSAQDLRPGPAKCLKCQLTFESWDVRKNRICPKCASGNDRAPRVISTAIADQVESMPMRDEV